jgi:hypothetical protein
MERLLDILTWKRSWQSPSEKEFLDTYIATIPNVQTDCERNYWVRIGEGSRTAFSCHTDTVHRDEGRQGILYLEELNIICKDQTKAGDGECLGADDGVGIWIMLNMIDAEIPGLYIFHRGEECGGIGSGYIATHNPALLKDIDRIVAFDRRGQTDIITHQAGGRCCSDEFAWALSNELVTCFDELVLLPSDRGLYTDTAEYTHIVPECTNLSVGYMYEHTNKEELDVGFATMLMQACMAVNWEGLPTVREPVDEWAYGNKLAANNGWNSVNKISQ